MRQAAREIHGPLELDAVIRQAQVCRLAMFDGEYPYIVPLNFGYDAGTLYFHCAREGKKLDLIQKNNRVAFELEGIAQIVSHSELPCKWTTRYQSVTGIGRAYWVTEDVERKAALDSIMRHYSAAEQVWEYPVEHFSLTTILRVEIEHMTGKQSKEFIRAND